MAKEEENKPANSWKPFSIPNGAPALVNIIADLTTLACLGSTNEHFSSKKTLATKIGIQLDGIQLTIGMLAIDAVEGIEPRLQAGFGIDLGCTGGAAHGCVACAQ